MKSIAPEGSHPAVQAVINQAQHLVKAVNDALAASKHARAAKTKVSKLETAKAQLVTLKGLVGTHSYLSLPSLEQTEQRICDLERDYVQAGYYAPPKPKVMRKDITRVDPHLMTDVCDGLVFHATLQLRTPLRVLLRHGEEYRGKGMPPRIARVGWEGIWLPNPMTWEQLGIVGKSDWPESDAASDIGPIKASEYLPFLLAVHGIEEADESLVVREAQLVAELKLPKWASIVARLGGSGTVLGRGIPARRRRKPAKAVSAEDVRLNAIDPEKRAECPDAPKG